MSTKAQLTEELKETQRRLADALKNDVYEADVTTLSSALLVQLDIMRHDASDAVCVAEEDLARIEVAYNDADDTDDRVRELSDV